MRVRWLRSKQYIFGLEVGNKYVAENFMACWVCEDGVCKVFGDGGRGAKVDREKDGFGTPSGNVIEPSDVLCQWSGPA